MMKATNLVLTLSLAIGVPAISFAAKSAQKAASDTESRRTTAENGVRQLLKAGTPSDALKASYALAADKNNAWLNAVCAAVESGASAPDSTASAEAASALVEWVIARNAALHIEGATLTGKAGDGVRSSIAQDLDLVGSESLATNRRASEVKRKDAVKALRVRFTWKTWDEVH